MIALVTDSNAMLPRWLRDRYRIGVVPLGLMLDREALLEDDDLDVAAVLRAMRGGATLTTSSPSPGAIAEAFSDAATDGASEILAVFVGSDYSSTVDSARLAATLVDVPVEIVDSHLASFSLGCCVWAAAEQLDLGGSLADAVAAVTTTSASMASVFTIAELSRAKEGGRFADGLEGSTGTPIVALDDQGFREVGHVSELSDAIETVISYVAERPSARLRVGVGDTDADEAGSMLAQRLEDLGNVAQVVRYRCGPSVAAHTGAGTFGAVLHPLP